MQTIYLYFFILFYNKNRSKFNYVNLFESNNSLNIIVNKTNNSIKKSDNYTPISKYHLQSKPILTRSFNSIIMK